MRLSYGDIDTCVAREKLACSGYNGKGVVLTGLELQDCATSLKATSCEDLLAGVLPATCKKPGALENGSACSGDYQCKSGACEYTVAGGCGACVPVTKNVGESCAASRCADGLTCIGRQCVRLGKLGGSCDAQRVPCATGLVCAGGKCQTPVASEDGACNPDESTCDLLGGFYCSRAESKCKAIVLHMEGDSCGLQANVFQACQGGASCVSENGSQVCGAAPKEGESCGPGRTCLLPATCVAGTCVLPGQKTCP
jgi:hypothetical protein